MEPLHLVLMLSIILCSLVAGLLFAFAVVVMPGMQNSMTRSIYWHSNTWMELQDNHPLFILVWAGSILSVIITLIIEIYLLGLASVYLFGVQLPTFRFNIPLNNSLQKMDIAALEDSEAAVSRAGFEIPWNRWNRIRTINSICSLDVALPLNPMFWHGF